MVREMIIVQAEVAKEEKIVSLFIYLAFQLKSLVEIQLFSQIFAILSSYVVKKSILQ